MNPYYTFEKLESYKHPGLWIIWQCDETGLLTRVFQSTNELEVMRRLKRLRELYRFNPAWR